MRRDAVVRIDAMANLEDLAIDDMAPSAERIAMARAELKWVFGLIANLPGRCREVIKARRVFGLSQNETAESLGMSVGMVEQETMRGMTLISEMIANVGVSAPGTSGKARKTKRAVKKTNVND
jgi:RNA polymerase sigma-70 factor (ECF subfamily)